MGGYEFSNAADMVQIRKRQRLIVKKGAFKIPLEINRILFCYSKSKMSFVVDDKGERYVAEMNLGQIEGVLDDTIFFRLTRQLIVHVSAIKQFRAIEFSKMEVILAENKFIKDPVIVSQFTAPDFKEWIERL